LAAAAILSIAARSSLEATVPAIVNEPANMRTSTDGKSLSISRSSPSSCCA
jgi:hypothetical protein